MLLSLLYDHDIEFYGPFPICEHTWVFITPLKTPCSSERLESDQLYPTTPTPKIAPLSSLTVTCRPTTPFSETPRSSCCGSVNSNWAWELELWWATSWATSNRKRWSGGEAEAAIERSPYFLFLRMSHFCSYDNEKNLLYSHVKVFASPECIIGVCIVGLKDRLGCTTLSISVSEEKRIRGYIWGWWRCWSRRDDRAWWGG